MKSVALHREPTAVPRLDELSREPTLAHGLPRSTVTVLLRRIAVAQSALVAELESPEPAAAAAPEADQMLTVDEAALLLRRGRRWLYRHADRLPFVKRIGGRGLLCSKAGIARWLASRTH